MLWKSLPINEVEIHSVAWEQTSVWKQNKRKINFLKIKEPISNINIKKMKITMIKNWNKERKKTFKLKQRIQNIDNFNFKKHTQPQQTSCEI